MADQAPSNVSEGSPEHVALKLLAIIANTEEKNVYPSGVGGKPKADRKWILDTYAECLHATKGYRDFSGT